MFAVGCPNGFPALAGANVEVDMHKLEYLTFDKLIIAPDLMDHHIRWHITRTRLTALCRDLASLGTTFVVVETLEELREQVLAAMVLLTDAQRTVSLADVHVLGTATGTWWDHITPRRADTDHAVLSHLRFLITGAWHDNGYTQQPFASLVEAIIRPADANSSAARQSGNVLACLRER